LGFAGIFDVMMLEALYVQCCYVGRQPVSSQSFRLAARSQEITQI
jgi:hypothetical protein